MKPNTATKLTIYVGLLIFAAALAPRAESVAWVVGQQTQGYEGPFIGRYDQYLVGNPRQVAYSFDFDLGSNLGQICAGPWDSYATFGNSQPDTFDFNCLATSDEIDANSGNVGFCVGGLNQNGVTIAQCYVTTQDPEHCDRDTVVDHSALVCTSYLECI